MSANIDRPHVVDVLDCRHDEANEPYLVLELLHGERPTPQASSIATSSRSADLEAGTDARMLTLEQPTHVEVDRPQIVPNAPKTRAADEPLFAVETN